MLMYFEITIKLSAKTNGNVVPHVTCVNLPKGDSGMIL
jgi:hypothetical protein